MQVASTAELATSATLGGGKTIDFGISNDPAFFQILSANLYSNQKLAMVRETLCNLWDAHIDADITNTSGLVTLTEDILTFRDFGKGIHPDLMGQVYGTYGASTKKNDSKSTGGFGLGCKSPFAYTDSFRVTSYHNGVMTVYNITKSSVESGGKPGITQIMQAPTDQTGLEVNIPIERGDVYEILQYIRYIVLHGEMKVELKVTGYYSNATTGQLPVMGMSFKPGSYSFNSSQWYEDYMGSHTVFVRYGNVIYPALVSPATKPAIMTIQRFMNIINVQRIVVQAEPDSLALTPSREALSSQKMTEDGIVDLCLNLTKQIEADIRKSIPGSVKKVAELFRNNPQRFSDCTSWPDWPQRMSVLQYHFITSDYGVGLRKHWKSMMRNATMSGYSTLFKDSKYRKQILNAICVAKESKSEVPYSKLFWQFVAKPLLNTFATQPDLDINNLRSVRRAPYRNIANKNHHVYLKDTDLSAMVKTFERKVVFITSRLKDITDSCEAWPDFKNQGHNTNYWIYNIGRKAGANLLPVTAFTNAGWIVVDLTIDHEWDPAIKRRAVRAFKPKEAKPKAVNKLVPIRNIAIRCGKQGWQFKRARSGITVTDQKPIEKPLFFVRTEQIFSRRLGMLCDQSMLTTEMLSHGVVVRNKTEEKMAIKRGAVPINEYFLKPLLNTLMSKDMATYCQKHKRSDLSEVHDVDAIIFPLLEAVDIKIPGLKKLWIRPDLDLVRDILNLDVLYYLKQQGSINVTDFDAAVKVLDYQLQEYTWIKQLKNIHNDMFMRHMSSETIIDLIAAYPERKAAFRSLILLAMKNGSKK